MSGNPILRIDPNGKFYLDTWEKKNRDEMDLFNQQYLARLGMQFFSSPEDNWGGSSRRSSGGVNDELPPEEEVEEEEVAANGGMIMKPFNYIQSMQICMIGFGEE